MSPLSYKNSRAILITDQGHPKYPGKAFPGYANKVEVDNITIDGYDVGIRSKNLNLYKETGYCSRVSFKNIKYKKILRLNHDEYSCL